MQIASSTYLPHRPKTPQTTPIFDRLVFERGDVPAQVRRDAQRLERELARAMSFNTANSAVPLHQAYGPPGASTVQ
ncbi:hypothetical protein ACFY3O_27815 [Streptomyces sp. NPDC001046]|uniref:hypothetical protein n=1 Tax=Streptomyces sp. NPDC001046 TaxID=3364543 RepID=UPI0036973701